MTTTVELNDLELRELCEVTHQPDAAAAVRAAMAEYLQSARLRSREVTGKTNASAGMPQVPQLAWKLATFSVPPDAPIIPGDRVAQILAEEEP